MSSEVDRSNPFAIDLLSLSKEEIQEFIFFVEDYLKSFPQADIPVSHYWGHDSYGREITVPKDTCFTGAVHKFKTLNILLEGEVTVISIDGVMRMKAPHVFVSSPNAKRLFLTHTETRWMTVHGTTETDPDKIKDFYSHNDKEASCQWLLQE